MPIISRHDGFYPALRSHCNPRSVPAEEQGPFHCLWGHTCADPRAEGLGAPHPKGRGDGVMVTSGFCPLSPGDHQHLVGQQSCDPRTLVQTFSLIRGQTLHQLPVSCSQVFFLLCEHRTSRDSHMCSWFWTKRWLCSSGC